MYILLSNDDGYEAEGIRCLAKALTSVAEVMVVAPDRNRSGASNSLTLEDPIRADYVSETVVRVSGTPTDCVHLAITGLFDKDPDIIISGINAGGNLGDDVLYSGTVAAAMEGRFLGLPSIAVSLVGNKLQHYDTAARVVVSLLDDLACVPLPQDTILNINVPDLPFDELAGIQTTRLGHRHKSEPVIQGSDPRGRILYWVGPPGEEREEGPGTDFHAVRNGFVSVTPLHVDLTRHSALPELSAWLTGKKL